MPFCLTASEENNARGVFNLTWQPYKTTVDGGILYALARTRWSNATRKRISRARRVIADSAAVQFSQKQNGANAQNYPTMRVALSICATASVR